MRFLRTLCVLGMTAIHYGHLRRQNVLSYLHLSGAAALFLSTVNRHSEAAQQPKETQMKFKEVFSCWFRDVPVAHYSINPLQGR